MILRGRILRTVSPNGAENHLIENADELVGVLRSDFDLDVPEVAMLWPKIAARHVGVFGADSV